MPRHARAGLCATTALLAFASAALADEPADRRRPVAELRDNRPIAEAASAIGLIRTDRSRPTPAGDIDYTDYGSGFLVSRCLVATARHVLGIDPRPASLDGLRISVRFGLGDDAGEAQAPIEATVIAYGGQGGRTRGEVSDDWAILRLKHAPKAAKPLDLLATAPLGGPDRPEFMMMGFPVDHFDHDKPAIWVDRSCGLREILSNGLIATSCLATSGNSGAPLLLRRADGRWGAVGVLVRADEPSGLPMVAAGKNFSLPMDRYLTRRITDEIRRDPCEAPEPKPPAG